MYSSFFFQRKITTTFLLLIFLAITQQHMINSNLATMEEYVRVLAWLPFETLIFTVITDLPNYKTTTLPVTRDLASIQGWNLRGLCTGDGPENPTPSLDRYYHAMCTGAIGGKRKIAEMPSH